MAARFGTGTIRDPEIIRLLRGVLSDRRISYRETIGLLRNTFDDDAVTRQEFEDLQTILDNSKTLDKRSRDLIEKFVKRKYQPKPKFIGQTYLTKNFRLEEFHCKFGKGTPVPSDLIGNIQTLCDNLQKIRDSIGMPVTISSGYRTSAHQLHLKNEGKTDTLNSQHCLAKAADIKVKGMSAPTLHGKIKKLIADKVISEGGLGLYNTFVHYDVRGTCARW